MKPYSISQSKCVAQIAWCGERGRPEDRSRELEIMRRKMVVMQRCLQEEQVRRQEIERRVEEQQVYTTKLTSLIKLLKRFSYTIPP